MDKLARSGIVATCRTLLQYLLKGVAIGAANAVPGLSGGTIALLLNVFERLLESTKSLNIKNIRALLGGRFREFFQRVDFFFLLAVGVGILLANVLLARLLEKLFNHYPVFTWSFFFGLVLASLFVVGKNVLCWSPASWLSLFCGTIVAFGVAILPPASENAALWYLFLCGIIAICSMVLPGLSGSYVLILLGNYQLLVFEGIGGLRWDILAPFLLGSIIGLLAFVRILHVLFKKYHDQTIAMLCGFIAGSLRSLWPWKRALLSYLGGEKKVLGHEYFAPQLDASLTLALLFMLSGAVVIILVEFARRRQQGTSSVPTGSA